MRVGGIEFDGPLQVPEHAKGLSGVKTPRSSPAARVTGLNTDPGG